VPAGGVLWQLDNTMRYFASDFLPLSISARHARA
jgi:hypothetical protein